MPAFVDLSHEIYDGMPVLPGLPEPRIGAHLDHATSRTNYEDAEFFLGKVDMPVNLGTYIDAPFHRFSEREDLADVDIKRIVGLEGWLLDATQSAHRTLSPELPDADLSDAAILIRTGWDRRWRTAGYWDPAPHLSEGFTAALIERKVGLVGIDSWNVDDTATKRRPIHTALLDAGILIVKHLTRLDRLPLSGFRFFAPVVAVRGGASFPVRAFAEIR